MKFSDKLEKLTVGPNERIVARYDLPYGAVRFSVVTPEVLMWFHVWDNEASETDIFSYASLPPKTAYGLEQLTMYVKSQMEKTSAPNKSLEAH